MDLPTALSTVSKALAAAVAGAVVALLARFGFNSSQEVIDALNVIVTALVGAGTSALVVYFAPKNKQV